MPLSSLISSVRPRLSRSHDRHVSGDGNLAKCAADSYSQLSRLPGWRRLWTSCNVVGALLNAQLNRNRDNRIRRHDRRGLAAALQVEAAMLRDSFFRNATEADTDHRPDSLIYVQDPMQLAVVWKEVAARVGLLGTPAIRAVVEAHGSLPMYVEGLLSAGASLVEARTRHDERRIVCVPPQSRRHFVVLSRKMGENFAQAVELLDKEILS